jgi:hypothetical protein
MGTYIIIYALRVIFVQSAYYEDFFIMFFPIERRILLSDFVNNTSEALNSNAVDAKSSRQLAAGPVGPVSKGSSSYLIAAAGRAGRRIAASGTAEQQGFARAGAW